MTQKADFNFFIGADSEELIKASNGKKENIYNNMLIQGVASDSSVDTDREVLEPNGFVLDRFIKLGFINYDHRGKDDPRYFIGEPVEAKVKNNKFIVKAKLYKDNPIARNLWDTMIMLKKSGSSRKVGFSIEGKALERDPQNQKRITKALITGLAATLNPKNGNSYADIVKGEYRKPLIDQYEYDVLKSVDGNIKSNRGEITYLIDITDKETGIRYTVDKDLRIKVEKAISTETAAPLIKEDLENKLKKLPFGVVSKSLKNVILERNKGNVPDEIFKSIMDNMSIYKKFI